MQLTYMKIINRNNDFIYHRKLCDHGYTQCVIDDYLKCEILLLVRPGFTLFYGLEEK